MDLGDFAAAARARAAALAARLDAVAARRRIVLLPGRDRSASAERVLCEVKASEADAVLAEQARLHPGRVVAAEYYRPPSLTRDAGQWVRWCWMESPVKEEKEDG